MTVVVLHANFCFNSHCDVYVLVYMPTYFISI